LFYHFDFPVVSVSQQFISASTIPDIKISNAWDEALSFVYAHKLLITNQQEMAGCVYGRIRTTTLQQTGFKKLCHALCLKRCCVKAVLYTKAATRLRQDRLNQTMLAGLLPREIDT
jgi:hypothetical protein